MATRLKDSSGDFVTIQEGESCNITGTLKDTAGSTVTSPITFTISLLDESTGRPEQRLRWCVQCGAGRR